MEDVCTAYVRIMNGLMNGRMYGLCTYYERIDEWTVIVRVMFHVRIMYAL